MPIHIRTGIYFCGELVSTIVYVILQGIGGLNIFLECIRCVKYKYRKIHDIWVAGILEFKLV